MGGDTRAEHEKRADDIAFERALTGRDDFIDGIEALAFRLVLAHMARNEGIAIGKAELFDATECMRALRSIRALMRAIVAHTALAVVGDNAGFARDALREFNIFVEKTQKLLASIEGMATPSDGSMH